eukprot:5740994-Prymnesium_polylepis.2
MPRGRTSAPKYLVGRITYGAIEKRAGGVPPHCCSNASSSRPDAHASRPCVNADAEAAAAPAAVRARAAAAGSATAPWRVRGPASWP